MFISKNKTLRREFTTEINIGSDSLVFIYANKGITIDG